jgi:hypothetical protein
VTVIDVSPSGHYAECFGEDCEWWGPIEECWHPRKIQKTFCAGAACVGSYRFGELLLTQRRVSNGHQISRKPRRRYGGV